MSNVSKFSREFRWLKALYSAQEAPFASILSGIVAKGASCSWPEAFFRRSLAPTKCSWTLPKCQTAILSTSVNLCQPLSTSNRLQTLCSRPFCQPDNLFFDLYYLKVRRKGHLVVEKGPLGDVETAFLCPRYYGSLPTILRLTIVMFLFIFQIIPNNSPLFWSFFAPETLFTNKICTFATSIAKWS